MCEASVRRAEGRAREAAEAAEAARELWERLTQFHYAALALVDLVEASFDLDDLAGAERQLAASEATAPIQRRPLLDAQEARLRAKLDARRGDRSADERYATAADRFRELEMRFWVGVTLVEHAEWLLESGRDGEVARLVAEATEIFEQLRARPWLERAARLAEPRRVAERPLAG
jgi:hypothetical protein